MKSVLDAVTLHYLSVQIPKYKNEPSIIRTNEKIINKRDFLKCSECGQCYTEIGSLIFHQIMKHQKESSHSKVKEDIIKPPPESQKNQFEKFLSDKSHKLEKDQLKLQCNFCGKILSCEAAKRVHERTQHKDGSHTCKYCGKFFRIRINGITHENRMHKHEENQLKPYKCSLCHQGFAKEFNYDQHMKKHESGEYAKKNSSHTCSICNNNYKTKRDMSRHFRRMHGSNVSYTCQYCGKFFSRQSDGQVHERKVHRMLVEQNKDFKCQFCRRGFDTAKYQELHERNHKMGELNCKNCKREFHYRAQCKSHEVICGVGDLIADDDLFICDYCGKKFARKGSLLPHFSSHFQIYTFSCELCGKSFKRKEALKRHLLALHSELQGTLIQCELCSKILSSMTALKRHYKQTHYIGKKVTERMLDNNQELSYDNGQEIVPMDQLHNIIVEEPDVAQTIEVYSFVIVPQE